MKTAQVEEDKIVIKNTDDLKLDAIISPNSLSKTPCRINQSV